MCKEHYRICVFADMRLKYVVPRLPFLDGDTDSLLQTSHYLVCDCGMCIQVCNRICIDEGNVEIRGVDVSL